MRPPLVLTALLVTALAGLGAACGSDDKDDAATTSTTTAEITTSSIAAETTSSTANSVTMAGETVPVARLLAVAAGLCEAAKQAPADLEAAEKTFNGRSHDGLHLIARGLQQIDRPASATLLEAKEKVESDFTKSTAATQLVGDLNHLHDVTVASLARFNVTAGACPPAA